MSDNHDDEKKDIDPTRNEPESEHMGLGRKSNRAPRQPQEEFDATVARTHAALGEIIAPQKAKALDLLPALVNAGFEVMHQFSDSHVLVGPPYFGGLLGIRDENGNRLMLRFMYEVSRTATAAQRERFLAKANDRLWAKYCFDSDGDLIIEHAICCEGGVFLPNIIRTILNFASLCRFTVKEFDPNGILAGDGDNQNETEEGERHAE